MPATRIGLEAAATTSIRLQGNTLLNPRKLGSPSPDGMGTSFASSTRITVAFWLQVNSPPASGDIVPVALFRGSGLIFRVKSNNGVEVWLDYISPSGSASIGPGSLSVTQGAATHWALVLDGPTTSPGTFAIYRNGELVQTNVLRNGPTTLNLSGGAGRLVMGNLYMRNKVFQSADIQMADVSLWNGYAATAQDVADLAYGVKRPSDIAAGQLAYYMTGDGGVAGNNVLVGDPGAANQGNDANFSSLNGLTYDFSNWGGGTGNSVQGSLTYAGPLFYTPTAVPVPYVPESGEGIGFLFRTTATNQPAHMAVAPTTRAAIIAANRHPTITIHRASGGVDNVTLDPNYAYFDNSNGAANAGEAAGSSWLYYDLRGQGVAAIGQNDSVEAVCQQHWIALKEGFCGGFSGPVSRSSPLPTIPAGRKTLRVGYNFLPPLGSTIPYYANWFRWVDRCQGANQYGAADPSMPRDAHGLLQPGARSAASYASGILLNTDDLAGYDLCATRGPQMPGGDGATHANPYYNNPAYGTAGFKLGWGQRTIPRRGKVHLVWDYVAGHDGDGTARICLGNRTDETVDLTGSQSKGNHLYSWTFAPPIQAGTDGTNYYRTYTYTANDPVNGVGSHGDRLTPGLRIVWTGWVTNIRITFEADADLPEAQWNVDKFNPPVWHPYIINEVLKDVDTVRLLEFAAAYGSSMSAANQVTPYDHYTWGLASNASPEDQGWAFTIPITTITPYPEAEVPNLRAAYAGSFYRDGKTGGFPVKLTLASPHYMKTGATMTINWGTCVTLSGTKLGGGAYNVDMDYATYVRSVRALSPTELFVWLAFDGGPGEQFGVLNRVYSGAELGGATIRVAQRRTLPLRAVGELASQAQTNIHYCLPYGIAYDPAETATAAAAIAAYFPANRDFYLECGNEVWNEFLPFGSQVQANGDERGLVAGAVPTKAQAFAASVDLTARNAKIFRQAWTAAGLDPSRVKSLVNVGPGGWLSYVIPRIAACNTSGDPLLRIDEISCNTYWSNIGEMTASVSATFPGAADLTSGQLLDLMELRVALCGGCFRRAGEQRAALDAAGLTDVKLSSYEGGSDNLTIGVVATDVYTNVANEPPLAAAAKLGMTQVSVFRSPRWAKIKQASFLRLQQIGVVRQTQYTANYQPWFPTGGDSRNRMQTRSWWTSYTSMERAGKGDGSDGLWDNRPSAARPYAPYAEGDSVSTDAYAIKAWNRMSDAPGGENQPPNLVLPLAVPAVGVGQPILFQASATDPNAGQTLTFSLDPGAPDGATIDPATGQFTWVPSQPGNWTITVRVTDNGSPPLSATGSLVLRAVQRPRFVPRRR